MGRSRRQAKLGIAAFVIGIVTGAGVAEAGHAYGPYGYYGPFAGYSYRNQAGIHTTSSDVWASTWVENQAPANVPTGYMAAMARSYKSGVLCKVADYKYNSQPLSGMSQLVFGSCGRGAYSSQGITKAYNGNGYNAYWTFQSPSQNF